MTRVSKAGCQVCAFVLLALFLIATSGCGSGSSSSGTRIRFVNASPDQATMNVLVDGTTVATAVANGGGATAYLAVTAGSRRIQIQDPATLTNLVDVTTTISAGTNTTFILKDFVTSTNTPLILADDNTAPAVGSFKLRAINLAPGLNGGADAYVVPSTTTTLVGVAPTVSGLPFPPSTSSTYVTNTAGSWLVEFTPASDQSQSWSSAATAFASGQVVTALLVEDLSGTKSVVLLTDK